MTDPQSTRKPVVNRFTATVFGTCPGCGKRAERQRSSDNLDSLRDMLPKKREDGTVDPGTVAPVWHKRCEP